MQHEVNRKRKRTFWGCLMIVYVLGFPLFLLLRAAGLTFLWSTIGSLLIELTGVIFLCICFFKGALNFNSRAKTILVCCGFIALQGFLWYGIDHAVLQKELIYESVSQDGKQRFALYKENENYKIQLTRNGKLLHEEALHQNFDHVRKEDTQWINDTYLYVSYVDGNFKTASRTYDFTKKNGLPDADSWNRALEQEQKKLEKKQAKTLRKKEPIKTETGISLHKNNTVAVTYDYGKHWKDTGIPVSFMTFFHQEQLRLSDESYHIAKAYSYIYYCHSNGYLMYAYTNGTDAAWNQSDTGVEAINTLWFQGLILETTQPGFFIADQTYGSINCLDFYESHDDGKSFVKHSFDLNKDMNMLADVSYIRHSLMFVSFYDEAKLYVTRDMGNSFQAVDIPSDQTLRYVETPYMDKGKLMLKAFTSEQKTQLFSSTDDGNTWIPE